MLKKSKLYLGLSLIIQSISFILLFFSFYNRKRSLAAAFLFAASASSFAGSFIISSYLKEETELRRINAIDEAYLFEDECNIPPKTKASKKCKGEKYKLDISFNDIDMDFD